MWKSIHPDLMELIEEDEERTRNWILEHLRNGEMIPFIVEDKSCNSLGSGCLLIKEDQPRPSSRNLKFPYLLSMYTEPRARRMGVASLIVEEAISWSKDNGYEMIVLHASKEANGLYQKFGFESTSEMRLKF